MKKNKEQPEDLNLGKKHSMMLSTSKRVFVWGQNKDYQLGIETSPDIISKSATGQMNEPNPKILSICKIKKIAAGYKHSLFINMQGTIHIIWIIIVVNN